MRSETEARAALSDLDWALKVGCVPEISLPAIVGEIMALEYILEDESPDNNFGWLIDNIRKYRFKADSERTNP